GGVLLAQVGVAACRFPQKGLAGVDPRIGEGRAGDDHLEVQWGAPIRASFRQHPVGEGLDPVGRAVGALEIRFGQQGHERVRFDAEEAVRPAQLLLDGCRPALEEGGGCGGMVVPRVAESLHGHHQDRDLALVATRTRQLAVQRHLELGPGAHPGEGVHRPQPRELLLCGLKAQAGVTDLQRRADARLQLRELEGLGEPIVGRQLHAAQLSVQIPHRAEYEDRDRPGSGIGTQLLEHPEAVAGGEHEIQQHQVVLAGAGCLESGLPIANGGDVVAGGLTEIAEELAGQQIVLDDQQTVRLLLHQFPSPRLPARLSKRVNSPRKMRSTLPMGPLRCLATISSTEMALGRTPPSPSSSPVSSRWMNITTSASCSMAPDSRRSESMGLPPLRSSTFRLSWLSASTGTSSSLESCLSAREISEISSCRLSERFFMLISWR